MKNKEENLSNEQRAKIIYQLVSTVSFLHSHGVVHGDIMPFNIFFDGNNNLKLANFEKAHHQVHPFEFRVKNT